MITIILIASILVAFLDAVPVQNPTTLKIDQRQEGDINSNFGLLDLFAKAIPLKSLRRKHHTKQAIDSSETQNFIESKTAPYHVDISQSSSKLEPNVEKNEEILNSRSKSEEKRELGRFAKAILVSVPLDEKEVEAKDESRRIPELQLIGSQYDQCGPDGYRNKEGVCVYVPGEVFL
ncbi:hypothetical protein Trydic_g10492 [Trypoxylus dichotomus]